MPRTHVTTESVKTKSEATCAGVTKDIPEETARRVSIMASLGNVSDIYESSMKSNIFQSQQESLT